MQKGFALIPVLIILLIVGVAGGVYYFQTRNTNLPPQNITGPTSQSTLSSDSTANWKTYTSKDGNFSLKYPENWYFKTAKENFGTDYKGARIEVLFSDKVDKNGKISSRVGSDGSTIEGSITISGCSYASGCNIWTDEDKFYDVNGPRWQGGGGPYPTTKIISLSELGGKKAVLIKSQAETNADVYKGEYSIQYNVLLNNAAKEHLTFTFNSYYGSNNDWVLGILNQILSTFEFLDRDNTEESIIFNGRKLSIKRVGEREYCEGRVGLNQTVYPKCKAGLKCEFRSGTAADAPGNCVKE